MKNLISSINRSPVRCSFFTVAIALAWFALSPPLKAQCPSACGAGGNTAVGDGALDSVTTGINNTAVGKDALTSNADGAYNVAIGRSALSANVSGNFNMAIGTEALRDSTANYNLAIGFRVGFMNTTGRHLTGIGAAALSSNTIGSFNTAIGSDALGENSTGEDNTAIGADALSSNTAGGNNTAVGSQALQDATGTGVVFNTAVGFQALQSTTANANTAIGDLTLENTTSGFFNVALGAAAGVDQTTGHNNIYIGQGSFGVAGESHTCYIQEIFGQTSTGGAFVFINSAGKLGTTTSSKRFKEDINPMDKSSEALFALKPVTFRYKKEIEPQPIPQWGLVAEDVEKVNPDLVVRDAEGKVNSVRYDVVYNMMLNEFLKEHRKVQMLEATVTEQAKGMETLTAQLKEQAALIQKVSAQLEASKPAPKVVANK